MGLLDRLKELLGGSRSSGDAEPPSAPVDPLGTTPPPAGGTEPSEAPPSAPRHPDE